MLGITVDQMRALEGAAGRDFAERLVAHCFQFAPAHAEAVGRAGVALAVTQGITRAAARGFDRRGPVRFWIDAMFMLGDGFDTDPQYPWVAPTLAIVSAGGQLAVADRLHAQTMHYLHTVGGHDGLLALAALRGLRERLRDGDPIFSAPPEQAVALMHALYPAKADYVGAPALEALAASARAEAAALGFAGARAVALVVVLMFSLGHHCLRSPLFPWVARTLDDPALPDPAARAARLEARMTAYLDHVLARAGAA